MKKILLVLMIGLGLIGCQRDYTFTDTDRPASPTDDSTLLLNYTEIYNEPGMAPDTGLSINFFYDNFYRLTSTHVVHSTDPVENNRFYTHTDYFYNNADTFSNKIISMSVEGVNIDMDTSFCFWNPLGQLAKDSTIHVGLYAASSSPSISASIKKYDYFSSYLTVKDSVYYFTPGLPALQSFTIDTFYQTFQNGNLIKQYSTGFGAFGGTITTDLNYTYDTYSNPFYSMKFISKNPVSEYDEESINFSQKNNCTKVIQSRDTALSNINCTYQYRLNGLPSVVNKIITESGSITNVKGIYTYGRR